MSLAGLKKQFNKANQYVSEKIGGAKGTELDEDFLNLEKKTDSLGRLIEEVTANTSELLQPNPAVRVKLQAQKSVSKLRGQSIQATYPQPEGQLGECFSKYGKEVGPESLFGQSLSQTGEAYKQLADIKYSLEDAVHQNFLEPLQQLQNRELKEVNFHRKKLHGRRLDYDCKKRKEKVANDEDIRAAEEKFLESKEMAECAMNNLLDNQAEHLGQLSSFVEAELEYHRNSCLVLQKLHESISDMVKEAASRPKKEYKMKKPLRMSSSGMSEPSSPVIPAAKEREANGMKGKEACCEALYDFEAENPGELAFKEGETIKLLSHIDENWLEGCLNGKAGYFPITYVKIVVDTEKKYQP